MFNNESKQKKVIGRGVRNRASRKGFIKGGVKTPYDYMSKEERKKLNGEVRVMNKYEDINKIPRYSEFVRLDKEEKARVLEITRKIHTYSKMADYWGISKSRYSKLLSQYVPTLRDSKVFDLGLVKEKYKEVDDSVKELKGFPSRYDIAKFELEDRKRLVRYALAISNASRLAQYWKMSPNTIIKVRRFANDGDNSLINTNEYLGILKRQFEKENNIISESEDKENNNIDIEEIKDKKSVLSDNGVILVPKRLDEIEDEIVVEEVKESNIVEYGGLNYSLNGTYVKEELKESLPPIVGILSQYGTYEVKISIKEIKTDSVG